MEYMFFHANDRYQQEHGYHTGGFVTEVCDFARLQAGLVGDRRE
jgi:hypothetical protein